MLNDIRAEKVCVVIPVYQDSLIWEEEASVRRVQKILKDRRCFFVGPESLERTYYENKFSEILYEGFRDSCFANVQTYSRLLLSPYFYKRFQRFQYMLIAQPDSFILGMEDRLDDFMELGYDYMGAPWYPAMELAALRAGGRILLPKDGKPRLCTAGNGGFSLRNIAHTINLLEKKWIMAQKWKQRGNEDTFFAYYGNDIRCEYTIAPEEISRQFALEVRMEEFIHKGHIPFAIHAWKKYLKDAAINEHGQLVIDNHTKL